MNYDDNLKSKDMGIFFWLLTLTILIILIILVGGLTRLTNSGLSMVDWQPIMGIFPPLSIDSWMKVFNEYKNSPEFLIVNKSINLDEFKYIFWWEWSHRILARSIALVLILPMMFFFIKKRISKKLFFNLSILSLLVLFQAIVGWWMVKSGLNENPYVSPYRLSFHLTNAIIILIILFWLTLNSWSSINIDFFPKNKLEVNFFILISLILLTIISGAFMSGTDAGQSFNTYPLMNDKFIPDDYFLNDYGIRNFFENTVSINFNHRWLATITFLAILFFSFYLIFIKKMKSQKYQLMLVIIFVILQFFLGILTLLTNVKIIIASMHQINSTLLLTSLLFVYYRIKIEKDYS